MEDNFILPFQLEKSHIRGRIVRMGSVLNEILSAHQYPDDVRHLTGEMAVMTAMLSSMLKYDGIFTLQTQSDGYVPMLVSDMTSAGEIRACATFREDPQDGAGVWSVNRAELLGKGYLAFTVDQGAHTDRYQGIVELKPESLVSSVQNYFAQSEQISTGMMMTVGHDSSGAWRGAGIMLQKMPEESARYNSDISNTDEDDWRRSMILLSSVKDSEMLDESLSAPDLLYRLFHEEGVRIYDHQPLIKTCRCSVDRVSGVLASMSTEDLQEMTVDGKITMTCEFCSRDYVLDPASFKKTDAADVSST